MKEINVLDLSKSENIENIRLTVFDEDNGEPYYVEGKTIVTNTTLDDYVKQEEIKNFVEKEDISDFITESDLNNYATKEDIPQIASSDQILTVDTSGIKANLSVSVKGNNVKVIGKDDIIIGEFNVLQSQIIKDVEIVDGILYITFIVDNEQGFETVDIDLSQFIDVYEGTSYITVNGREISLNYSLLSDKLIDDDFIKKDDLSGFVTGDDIKDFITDADLDNFATMEDLDNYLPLSGGYVDGYIRTSGNISTNNKTGSTDGLVGVFLSEQGGIEISNADTPYIDFHYQNSINDYDIRFSAQRSHRISFITSSSSPMELYIGQYKALTSNDVQDIYEEVDNRVSVNTSLIDELSERVVDIYNVPDKWFDGIFNNITYEDCREFTAEWRKNSYFQHNNDLFSGATIITDTDSSFIFSYGFLTVVNVSLTVYYVQVSCVLHPGTSEWVITVNGTPTTYISQTEYDIMSTRINQLEERINQIENPSIL